MPNKHSQKLIDNHRKLARGLASVRLVRVVILTGFVVGGAVLGVFLHKNSHQDYEDQAYIKDVNLLIPIQRV
jgi:hypothetical protein